MRNTKTAIGGAVRDSNGNWLTGFDMVTRVFDVFRLRHERLWKLEVGLVKGFHSDTIRNGFTSISNIAEVRLIHEWCTKD
ncbi:hypothetical protein PVK06_023221 [Gossypium arboreum]|uniref:Uncharacterized protein n=1 Tax=Gossypium arboreum TaxID=29729 RepID=A0ABR0PAL2_GOSAR|nr:hypothetical protein PVK06_023221 [Gossypium arboreum]